MNLEVTHLQPHHLPPAPPSWGTLMLAPIPLSTTLLLLLSLWIIGSNDPFRLCGDSGELSGQLAAVVNPNLRPPHTCHMCFTHLHDKGITTRPLPVDRFPHISPSSAPPRLRPHCLDQGVEQRAGGQSLWFREAGPDCGVERVHMHNLQTKCCSLQAPFSAPLGLSSRILKLCCVGYIAR